MKGRGRSILWSGFLFVIIWFIIVTDCMLLWSGFLFNSIIISLANCLIFYLFFVIVARAYDLSKLWSERGGVLTSSSFIWWSGLSWIVPTPLHLREYGILCADRRGIIIDLKNVGFLQRHAQIYYTVQAWCPKVVTFLLKLWLKSG